MNKIIPYLTMSLFLVFGSTAQTKRQDPIITFKVSLPQASSIIYTIRNSTIMDAKSANELADFLVAQANDTTLNKPPVQKQPIPQKHK